MSVPDDELWLHVRRARRNALLFAAVMAPAFVLADWLAVGGLDLPALLTRLGWAVALAIISFLDRGASRRFHQWLMSVAALLSTVAWAGVCVFTGGSSGGLFPWTLAVPLAIAVLLQEEAEAVAVGALGTTALSVYMLIAEHRTPREIALWSSLLAASGICSIFSAISFRRLRSAEREAERMRQETAHQLASNERRLAIAERLAVIGQLAASVAHELSNPLTAANLHVRKLSMDLAAQGGTELQGRVKTLEEALVRMGQVVADLKRFSRQEGRPSEVFAPAEVVLDTARLARVRLETLGRFVVNVPPTLRPVKGDRGRFGQVLLNLLMNAADAVEEYRPKSRDGLVKLLVSEVDAWLRVAIEDNGPGIPAEVMPQIFELFFTTKGPEKGTGMGLALCREYVEQGGGKVWAENRAEGGARFVVELPLEG